MNDAKQGLERFVDAQQPVYATVCQELAAGNKRSHWMWFIFPQMRGLGRSTMAERYGLASAAEAAAYWQHPLLGPRLKACTELMLASKEKSASDILGSPDDMKFRSCLTLFAQVVPAEPVFRRALEQFFGGRADERTLALLNPHGSNVDESAA